MDIKNETKIVFLVLVPHQDMRLELRKYCDSLKKIELKGVYPFPLAAPLAVLSKPLNPDELKNTARLLRNTLGANKIYTGKPSALEIPTGKKDMTLLGLKIDLDIQELFTQRHGEYSEFQTRRHEDHGAHGEDMKDYNFISPLVLGTLLIPKIFKLKNNTCSFGSCGSWLNLNKLPSPPKLSFRAAAIANMTWEASGSDENGEAIFEYKIGKLCWLPKTNQL